MPLPRLGPVREARPARHPGALNPAVTDANIHETICRLDGYTGSERPPDSVTEPEKRAEMAAYDNRAPLSTVELDHDVPLTLGGAVNDMRNYWPEPNHPGSHPTVTTVTPRTSSKERCTTSCVAANCHSAGRRR